MTDAIRRWYERELGWPTADGEPVQLLTGVRFDVLEIPAVAGHAVLRRVPRTGPVTVAGPRMRFLVATGGADELPELLDWLEWRGVPLDLTALGPGGRMPAPALGGGSDGTGRSHGPAGREPQEAAFWLRPPDPGRDVEPTLPVAGFGGDGGAPDLVRLVSAAATECHRARLLDARRQLDAQRLPAVQPGQPLAFSYASRTVAGTRPRSLTS